ncbi:MAG: hypothetical protein HKP58_01185 [Desulfatitalea sp.]|nr:hypothetical protein [Desulfatitalea sp.]NNJ99000.1 hypothetical protein [Desulfatitalea sp.]
MTHQKAGTPTIEPGPKEKRERQLMRRLKWAIIAIIVQAASFGIITAVIAFKPERVVVVDRNTGEVIGEYQTTAFRGNQELIAGAKRFAQYHLSFNSATVYDDFAMALNMMSEKLRKERIAYLKESNLARDIKSTNSISNLEFNEKETRIVEVKGPYAKVELAGDVAIGDRNTVSSEILVNRNKVAFRMLVDIEMVAISSVNTSGIKVVDYYEFK